MKLLHYPRSLFERGQMELADDFTHFSDGDAWTKLDADSGATVAIDADGTDGVMLLTTGATDNNEASLASTNELFLFAADRAIVIEAHLQFAEANTDDANVAFGLADAWGANLLGDNGAGPKSSYSGCLIYKADGDTVWSCHSSVGSSQTNTQSTTTAGGASYHTLKMEIVDRDSSEVEVTFFVDDVQLADANNRRIKHRVAYASATEMNLGVYAKAGGGNSEVVSLDYLVGVQRRGLS